MRNRGSGLLDLIRIKMKNLLEVSEIVDNSIIHEYLSRVGDANRSDVLRWFTRERNAAADTRINDDPIGRPNILKLANRFESYVDIENKVNATGRSSSSMTTPHVDTKATASDSGYESNAESETETNAASDSVAGIMV
jgi:hypothetical protein